MDDFKLLLQRRGAGVQVRDRP
ncbi:uncharacterized protein G2W53_021603 [Senna tora]|uniref:Uncharacterized protein n=1 Tax=Senna tora TaxID=362788 RepID=A0A834WNJ4_9FABA|nr:uncharacterized protein G2W53_021603 [Senna tora]